jgi:hypothetical protein
MDTGRVCDLPERPEDLQMSGVAASLLANDPKEGAVDAEQFVSMGVIDQSGVVFEPTVHHGEAHIVGTGTITASGAVRSPIRHEDTVSMKRIQLVLHYSKDNPGRLLEAHGEEGELLSFEPGEDFADVWFRVGEDLEEHLQAPDDE